MSFEQGMVKAVTLDNSNIYTEAVPLSSDAPYTFLDFVRKNASRFFTAFNVFAQTCPTLFNAPDHRMLKGLYSCSCLEKVFGCGPGYILKNRPMIGHDMLFHNGVRVSVKTMNKVFQRPWRYDNDKLTNAGNIMVKNRLGHISANNEQDYDYMIVAQTGFDKHTNTYDIGFAVATYETVCKNIISTNNDQVIANIKNNEWDYFSGIETYQCTTDVDEQNVVFKTKLNGMFTELGKQFNV